MLGRRTVAGGKGDISDNITLHASGRSRSTGNQLHGLQDPAATDGHGRTARRGSRTTYDIVGDNQRVVGSGCR